MGMELILQHELPHQQKAIDAISEVLNGVYIQPPRNFYANPEIMLSVEKLRTNIRNIQQGIPTEYRSKSAIGNCLNLDIKMETGTGKTYVYTKTMYELHKRYGFNKFIIAVPSLAIKAGTANFLTDNYVSHHFSEGCGYDCTIETDVLAAPKNQKKGRSYFPSAVSNFMQGSCQDKKKIYVLLINMQLLTNAKLLTRDDYNSCVEDFYRPLDAIKATRSIVIIDEPHRFARDQKAFKVIQDEIQPQCIIRFGATFPDISSGRGKTKIIQKDYQNLLYDLNACASFNQGLIKGIAKEHFEPISRKDEKIKIASIDNKDAVHIQYKKHDEATKSFLLKKGDSLAIVNDAFSGITITAIGRSSVEFSNGLIKNTGEELDVDIYMTSYQEQMLHLALERHFKTEKENFCGRTFKIKTLALFFIDDITSYRQDADGKKPYLLEAFERLLKEEIQKTIKELNECEHEYKEYLEASLANISACHAGYFSQDNNDSDEEIAKEVDIILNGKKRLLDFRNPNGSYNTLRFLFSKWTLKEGWDNPNVFTIAKLRSSGSENSKLQEVGRGLRLPVDECGNRISNEEFMLNYIVDFTEADFAQKLVNQINGEIPHAFAISDDKLTQVAAKLGKSADELFEELFFKHYIDRHQNIIPENKDVFFAEYPDFMVGLASGKIKDRNKEKNKTIKIRPGVYEKVKELWEKINQKYMLVYDKDLNEGMEETILSILEESNVFTDVTMTSKRELVKGTGNEVNVVCETGVQYRIVKPIPYGAFLKRISSSTNLQVKVLHAALCKYATKNGRNFEQYINEDSAAAFCSAFTLWKNQNLQGHFHYEKSHIPVGATVLSFSDGKPRPEIAQGRIGTKMTPGTPSAKYLYDTMAYDSPLEKENISTEINQVIVYGKIPRCSIAIPTITGGTYSPDFMYIVEKASGEKELNLIVETKDVENKTSLRDNENTKLKCAEVFFNMLTKDGYKVVFRNQLGNKQMLQIINEVLLKDKLSHTSD